MNTKNNKSGKDIKKRLLTLLPYVLIPVMIISGITLYAGTQKKEKLEYYQVVSLFDEFKVTEYSLNLSSGALVYKVKDDPQVKNYTVPNVNLFMQDVHDDIMEYNRLHKDAMIKAKYVSGSSGQWIVNILPTILLLVVMGGFTFVMFRRMSQTMNNENNRTMSFGKARVKQAKDEKRKTTFADVAGADEEKEELLSLQYSSAITLMEKSGLKVNTASRTLEGEGETFSYGEGAMFLYEDEPISAESIEPCDILELKVYEDKVWCIEVAEYHGYITVKNAKDVKNGKFQLDEETPIALQEAEKIPVRAGLHTIKITGDNIEPKTETITVTEGEESFCDVSRVQEKMGVIIVNANVSDYKLYINGSTTENPAVLPFGEYEVVILKGGYEEWSQKISLQQDSVTVQAELKELKQPEPPKEEGKKEPFQFGTLTITANCDGAVVYINGEQYGIAPMEVNLPYNSYTIRLEKEGYAPYEKGITIGEPTASLHAQLQ